MKSESEIRERLDELDTRYQEIPGNDIDVELDAMIRELVWVLGS